MELKDRRLARAREKVRREREAKVKATRAAAGRRERRVRENKADSEAARRERLAKVSLGWIERARVCAHRPGKQSPFLTRSRFLRPSFPGTEEATERGPAAQGSVPASSPQKED